MITGHQYRRLMKHYKSSGVVDHAAMKAGMHRETARRYIAAQSGPGSLKQPHTWRPRSDPLSGIWPEAERWLEESPEGEAKALFEYMLDTYAGKIEGHTLRTLQRDDSDWLQRHGPAREVLVAQVHEIGECIQTGWSTD